MKLFPKSVTFEQYAEFVYGRLSEASKVNDNATITTACLGLAGEVGELIEHFKKLLFHGKPLNREEATKELGDVHFYLALMHLVMEITPEEVMLANMEKLANRPIPGAAPIPISEELTREDRYKKAVETYGQFNLMKTVPGDTPTPSPTPSDQFKKFFKD